MQISKKNPKLKALESFKEFLLTGVPVYYIYNDFIIM
ncbi:MAG: hypothetical protein JWN56_2621 [Sphingobacteriales bacterium]|nr:hypothetical protein [Sphingobacteriales bacterium]